ncbi:MAG: hypothetical protein KDA63_10425 [Planctomycetales bacterium]|nr:hypothetical protein [Planctomycetales bacterium]
MPEPLPVALLASVATYVAVLASLAPQRVFFGSALVFAGMAVILFVVGRLFGDIGQSAAEVMAPFVVQQLVIGPLLVGARLLRFRFCRIAPGTTPPASGGWQFPLADLLPLTAGLALCLSMLVQFDYQWLRGGDPYSRFTRELGVCLAASSLATAWFALSDRWRRWVLPAAALAPVGALPAWFVRPMLFFDFYWYGVLTAAHAGFLLVALWLLRPSGFRLVRLPHPRPHAPERDDAK